MKKLEKIILDDAIISIVLSLELLFFYYSFNFIINMDGNILTANHERILLSMDRSILTRNAITPYIILVVGWAIYMFSTIIWKKGQCSKRFNCKNKLGGAVYPDQFNSSIDDDLKTIAEDDNICIRGLSYDKYRYDTLKRQMRGVRNRFFSLGMFFLVLSLPTIMFIMYYSNIFDIIYTRVDRMEYRMDAVRIAMDLLDMKRSAVTNMAGELVTLLSDNVVTQTCFESSNQLLDTSSDVISAMSSIRIPKSDIGDVKNVVMDAAGEKNDNMIDHTKLGRKMILILFVSFLNLERCIKRDGINFEEYVLHRMDIYFCNHINKYHCNCFNDWSASCN